MSLIAYLPLIVCIIGLFMWLACEGKASAVGEKLFICGLLVTLFVFSKTTIHLN